MKKQDVITFKADEDLMKQIRDIPNRSEFIRHAILQALDSVCPLCQGSGIFSPAQKKHWDAFLKTHTVQKCNECNELYISCVSDKAVEHDSLDGGHKHGSH